MEFGAHHSITAEC